MSRVVKGRIINPTTVELDEPLIDTTGEVEVLVRVADEKTNGGNEALSEFLRRLPPGLRTKEDIDRQIREEHDSWGDR